jgi:RimJ/RimL family protein N-acetyltransferase
MKPAPSEKAAKKPVRLETVRFVVREARLEDASAQWGNWMADAEASQMLNAPARALTRAEVEAYIKKFDQRTHLLLVILEKASQRMLGCFRIDIDEKPGRFLVSMIVGEPDYRHKGIMNELTVPFRDYFFDTLGLKIMLGTVLSHNEPVIRYLFKTGLKLDRTVQRHVKSRTDDAMLDLCYFSQTAEAWRAWKRANLANSDRAGKAGTDASPGRNGSVSDPS